MCFIVLMNWLRKMHSRTACYKPTAHKLTSFRPNFRWKTNKGMRNYCVFSRKTRNINLLRDDSTERPKGTSKHWNCMNVSIMTLTSTYCGKSGNAVPEMTLTKSARTCSRATYGHVTNWQLTDWHPSVRIYCGVACMLFLLNQHWYFEEGPCCHV